jgi:hypothetical protein
MLVSVLRLKKHYQIMTFMNLVIYFFKIFLQQMYCILFYRCGENIQTYPTDNGVYFLHLEEFVHLLDW